MPKSDGLRPLPRTDATPRRPLEAPEPVGAAPEPVLRLAAELGRLLGRQLAAVGPLADRVHASARPESGKPLRSRPGDPATP